MNYRRKYSWASIIGNILEARKKSKKDKRECQKTYEDVPLMFLRYNDDIYKLKKIELVEIRRCYDSTWRLFLDGVTAHKGCVVTITRNDAENIGSLIAALQAIGLDSDITTIDKRKKVYYD